MRESELLGFIIKYTETHGWAPSYREIAAEIGCGLATVQRAVAQARCDGYLTDAPTFQSRVLSVTDAGREVCDG